MEKDFLLCIDTTGAYCSVALSEGINIIEYLKDDIPLNHSSSISVLTRRVLRSQGLSFDDICAISINIGPGSFTSLRVGISFTKAISYVKRIPYIALNAFEIMVHNHLHIKGEYFLALLKARKNEVFYCLMDQDEKEILPPGYIEWNREKFQNILSDYSPHILMDHKLAEDESFNVVSTFAPLSAQEMISKSWSRHRLTKYDNIYTVKPLYIKAPHITVSKKTRTF